MVYTSYSVSTHTKMKKISKGGVKEGNRSTSFGISGSLPVWLAAQCVEYAVDPFPYGVQPAGFATGITNWSYQGEK